MKTIHHLIFILSSFTTTCLFAQNEGNVWCFGYNNTLDFNTGTPVILGSNTIDAPEGCSSVADGDGNLLFYTDGSTACWNKNHDIMLNGASLSGNLSSTQSALIVKTPGSSSGYYVFTTSGSYDTIGLAYSVVDMTMDGGLGGVVPGQKNIAVLPLISEKLTAVLHENDTDIWIVTHTQNSDAFYSYLLTGSGLDPTPVISNIGPVIGSTPQACAGYIKASPDGNRLAMANSIVSSYLFDFNKNTGVLSNAQILMNSTTGFSPYGVEFSASGQYLYITNATTTLPEIYQFDLNAADIAASKEIIGSLSTPGLSFGALQRGPDDKIYVAIYGYGYLGSILNPELQGIASGFVQNQINLGANYSLLGLPNYINSVYKLPNTASLVNEINRKVSVFPNPATDYLNISAQLNPEQEIVITNSIGVIVKTLFHTNGKVDVSDLTPGIYFAHFIYENKQEILCFMKQ